MRKLKLQVQVSIDGFIAGPKGEMDWMVWNWDDELIEFVAKITEPVDTIVLGRKLARGFIPHWASNPEELGAAKINSTKKVVFTKTLDRSEWDNTEIVNGDLVEGINKLKKLNGKDIIAYGGGGFVSSLVRENLIDEYHLFINPSILGSGMTIFNKVKNRIDLKLQHSKNFECGITVQTYTF